MARMLVDRGSASVAPYQAYPACGIKALGAGSDGGGVVDKTL